MQLQRSGRPNDLFIEELRKRMPVTAKGPEVQDVPKDQQLEESRKEAPKPPDQTTEVQLDKAHKDPDGQTGYEKMLAEHRAETERANQKLSGITEQQLDTAKTTGYPHRNPKAHERAGNKRPINALGAEMGNACDNAKRKRFEDANQPGPKRSLDQDIGSQMSIKAFNRKQSKTAATAVTNGYLAYKTASMDKFAEVRVLDSVLSGIMETVQAENRAPNNDEMAQIFALKKQKIAAFRQAQMGEDAVSRMDDQGLSPEFADPANLENEGPSSEEGCALFLKFPAGTTSETVWQMLDGKLPMLPDFTIENPKPDEPQDTFVLNAKLKPNTDIWRTIDEASQVFKQLGVDVVSVDCDQPTSQFTDSKAPPPVGEELNNGTLGVEPPVTPLSDGAAHESVPLT